MNNNIQPIRGMKDLYAVDMDKYEFIISTARKISKKYCYSLIETPIVESTAVFHMAIGNETDVVSKEMYTFLDKGKESLTLRPEGTAGVMRAIASNHLMQSTSLPLKLMYYGPMFRYDRPQKGRYRQFHQIGFEYLGNKGAYTDAITISLAYEILVNIGLYNCTVFINSLGGLSSRQDYIKALVRFFSLYKEKLSPDSQIRLDKNPLRILDSKDLNDRELCKLAPKIQDYLNKEDRTYFNNVCNLLNKFGIRYEIDSNLVRGLDYYTHTTFEIKLSDGIYTDAIGGGGRYDNLLKLFGGPDISGIGFALGIERLMMLIDYKSNLESKIAVIPVSENEDNYSLDIFQNLLQYDFPTEFIWNATSLRKKIEIASKLNCKFLLIIGEDEVKTDQITVKQLTSNEDISIKQKKINRNQIINFLKTEII